ncbi:hypothetical protein BCT93_16880 [Vibrio lentus]|nr:hypothetical protein BCT93_16880 [Vibrio lentus]
MYFKAQSVVDWAFSLCDTQKCLYQAEKRREEKRWDEIEMVACRQGEFINGTKARTLFLV